MKKQESLLDLRGCREFSTMQAFYSSTSANKFVNKNEFQFNHHGNDPCIGHCKLIFEKLQIEYLNKNEILRQKYA